MRREMRTALIAALLTGSPASAAITRDYSLFRVEEAMSSRDRIGTVKSGLICLPKGALRWRDIARPSESDLKGRIQALLAGGDPDQWGDDPFRSTQRPDSDAHYQVAIKIEHMAVNICVPGLGIGERKVKSAGELTARIATLDTVTHQRLPDRVISAQIVADGLDLRRDPRVYEEAVAGIIRKYLGAGD